MFFIYGCKYTTLSPVMLTKVNHGKKNEDGQETSQRAAHVSVMNTK